MKKIFKIVIAIGFLFAAYSPAHAYRPFATEDAGVAGKGVAQLEVSWDYLKWEDGKKESNFLLVPIYGITDRIELSIEIPYIFHNPEDREDEVVEDEDGIGDINIVGKFLLIEEGEKNPAFTIKAVMKTSSGSAGKGLGSGDKDYSVVAAASKTIGGFQLHGMFGYTFVGDNDNSDIRDIYIYGIGGDYGLTENLHIVAEVAGNRHSDRTSDDDPSSGLIGATYKISEHLTIDGGIRFGFNDSMPDWNTTIGMSVTF